MKLIITATVLLITGVVLPFLMILEMLEPTLLLSFVAAMSSTTGLFVGIIGIAMYVRARR